MHSVSLPSTSQWRSDMSGRNDARDNTNDCCDCFRLRHGSDNTVHYAKFSSRSHDAVIHIYGDAHNVIETHEAQGRVQREVSGQLNIPWNELRAWARCIVDSRMRWLLYRLRQEKFGKPNKKNRRFLGLFDRGKNKLPNLRNFACHEY